AGCADRDHARRHVDGITPNIELVSLLSDDACHDRTGMDTHADLPTKLSIHRGGGHFQAAAYSGFDGIADLVEEPRRCHESIADGLDLLEAMLGRNALEYHEEGIQSRDDLFRFMAVAIGGEIGHTPSSITLDRQDVAREWLLVRALNDILTVCLNLSGSC